VVGTFLGGVRRLGAGSIEGGEDWRGASHGEPEAVAAALDGSGIPVGIEGRLGVREHERESGQLARGFTTAEDVRKWLPMVSRGHWRGGRKGDGGARVPGCDAAQAQWGKEQLGTREAHEQRIKGSEGALGPCHGGGDVSTGRESKGAVAPAEESVRARSRLGGEENDAWKGRSRRWSGDGAERRPGELYRRRSRGHARAAGKTEEHGGSRRKTEDSTVKRRKLRGLTVKHEQLSHHCSNEDGPKSKNV
jgi:hypothetical protein